MGEYEDRYPEAYGQGEATAAPKPAAKPARRRRFLGIGLPRQVRGEVPAGDRPLSGQPEQRPSPLAHPMHSDVPRTPRQICDDIWERLNQEPSIDISGITVSVADTEVTLDGTINSLIAISLAQTLVASVAGVSRVQVSLRVVHPPGTVA